MGKWEYKVFFDNDSGINYTERYLNAKGEDRWEAYAVVAEANSSGHILGRYHYLKRRIQEEPKKEVDHSLDYYEEP
jgi:hypothetical protein